MQNITIDLSTMAPITLLRLGSCLVDIEMSDMDYDNVSLQNASMQIATQFENETKRNFEKSLREFRKMHQK